MTVPKGYAVVPDGVVAMGDMVFRRGAFLCVTDEMIGMPVTCFNVVVRKVTHAHDK